MFLDNSIMLRLSGVKNEGQVMNGIRWMPWYAEAMKDVANCDKPREVVSTR